MAKLTSAEKLEIKKKKIELKTERKAVKATAKEEQKSIEVAKKNLQEFNNKSDVEKELYYLNPRREEGDQPYNTVDDTDDFNFRSKFVVGDFVSDSIVPAQKSTEAIRTIAIGEPMRKSIGFSSTYIDETGKKFTAY